MKKLLLALCLAAISLSACNKASVEMPNSLRPPAYPLVTIDPYTSAWAMSNILYDDAVRHWTGSEFPLLGALKVDGEVFRFMGVESIPMTTVVPMASAGKWDCKYVFDKPRGDWTKPSYNDRKWESGQGAIGTVPGNFTAGIDWRLPTKEVWVRRIVNIDQDLTGRNVWIEFTHDDDVQIFINGIKVVDNPGARDDMRVKLTPDAVASLKQGENLMAAYCINTGGPGFLDFGIVVERENALSLQQTAIQKSVDVQPMQTIYDFTCGPVDLKLTFTAPLFLDDLELVSRPVNYISYDITSNDGVEHDIEIYFEASPAWALDSPSQPSESETFEDGGLLFVKSGSKSQDILGRKGDQITIGWGYFYMAADKESTSVNVGDPVLLRKEFANGEATEKAVKKQSPDNNMSMIRKAGKTKGVSDKVMIGYDDLYSVQFFGDNLRPYWNRTGKETIQGQFHKANADYSTVMKKALAFGNKMMAEAEKAGGRKYAEILAPAYRQSIAAHKLVESDKAGLLWLSKENASNGSIGTVDITYPSAPLFLYYNTEFAKGLLNHIFYYSESGKWTKPFPSHDVGTYPLANGQTYGGDMPIEEAGNMIITAAAITRIDGNADYAKKHWKVMTIWTDYMVENGLDPENQLCTDDFAGHFAHNVNLSVKAIMAIASYSYMAEMMGMPEVAERYMAKAHEMGRQWMEMADDGDHYRLTFDKPGTWSMKYNMVWDDMMGYHIWPEEVKEKELAYYITKENKYGVPLDNREKYTKTDWIMWTATMAKDKATFEAFIDPVWRFYNEQTTRMPMSDWVWTDRPQDRGFRARSTVGGFWIKMLDEYKIK